VRHLIVKQMTELFVGTAVASTTSAPFVAYFFAGTLKFLDWTLADGGVSLKRERLLSRILVGVFLTIA